MKWGTVELINLKKYIPDGTRDILFEECNEKRQIEDSLRKIYTGHGYDEVISPTLEFYDVFNMNNQPIPQEKMYKLFDNLGRILVLRPDMTTPIGRIAATKIKKEKYPVKLCYNADIFRVNENLNGKLNEFTQSGVEIIGEKSIRADVEAIITGIKALNKINLKNFKIEIGESQFFKYIIEDIDLDQEEKEKIRLFIQNKNISALKEFLNTEKDKVNEKTIEILEELPELFGGKEVIAQAEALTVSPKALRALENLKKVYKLIENLGMEEYISIDLGMVQHINYYTGLIFRGYCIDAGDDILSGGRYDKLIRNFGESFPATGFAINVDSVQRALKIQGFEFQKRTTDTLIFSSENDLGKAYKLLEELNCQGISAEVNLSGSEEKALAYGLQRGIKNFINVSKQIKYTHIKDKWIKADNEL